MYTEQYALVAIALGEYYCFLTKIFVGAATQFFATLNKYVFGEGGWVAKVWLLGCARIHSLRAKLNKIWNIFHISTYVLVN